MTCSMCTQGIQVKGLGQSNCTEAPGARRLPETGFQQHFCLTCVLAYSDDHFVKLPYAAMIWLQHPSNHANHHCSAL
jgi:hypothetical protein